MEELDLSELFSLFWNKKIEIILITLIAIIIGVIYSYFFITPTYTAKTSLILVQSSDAVSQNGNTGITSTDLTINSKLVSTYSDIVKRNVVLDQVANNLGISKSQVQAIKNRISVSQSKDTEIIDIKVTDEDPNYATKIANEVATVFSEKIVDIYNMSNVYLLEKAEVPTIPSNINHIKDIAIFAFVGIVASVFYVLIFNLLDHTVKSEEDIEKNTDLLVLATMPNYEAEFKPTKGGKR